MATADNPARALSINFHVSVCVDAETTGPIYESFDRFFSTFSPFRKAGWKFERSPLPPHRLYNAVHPSKEERLFLRIDGTFTRCSRGRVERQDDVDKFNSLFRCTSAALKSKAFMNTCGKDKLVVISWALSESHQPFGSQLSRWVFPAPSYPIHASMQALELVLHNNLGIKSGQLDSAHSACGIGASLGCIESWLWQQKVGHSAVNDTLDALETVESEKAQEPPTNTKELIENATKALEVLDKSLNSLVYLIDTRIGRYPAVEGKLKLFAALRALIRGPLMAVAIDDADLEAHKKQARRSLATLQRVVPVLAFHIRLHDQETRVHLREAYDKAGPGPEKREMTDKLAVSPKQLENKRKRAEQMRRVRKAYEHSYNGVVAEVEAVNKLVGAEYCRRGEEVLKVWGRESDDSSEWSLEEWDEKGKS
ncbi:hypothetical protein B0T18DRAFT_448022 [Schizothecium vesticola]|uniref:Uncharacterized protein n=1 Tax=Schizothecium vesticola TaxID=314040 RepID=A0AA40K274_9PEZI|nr:hypothetical protein B0T18DRAFT_448022 [Schizothecium vesticola]